ARAASACARPVRAATVFWRLLPSAVWRECRFAREWLQRTQTSERLQSHVSWFSRLMRIYLDNNATTAIHPDVLRVLEVSLRELFGNASSIHKEGQAARRAIEDARESVARLIGATPREIGFTSGGTESNNAAIFGATREAGRCHIVTSAIEHPSVAEA